MIASDNKPSTSIAEYRDVALPTPSRIDLKSIDDVRLELARLYREMRAGTILTADGTRLAYVLTQIGKLIELHDIEKRIEELEVAYESKK